MSDKINNSEFAVHETIRIVRDVAVVVRTVTEYDGLSRYIYQVTPSQIAMILGALMLPLIWLLSLIIRPVIGSLPVVPPPIRPRMLVLPKPIELRAYPVKIVAPSFTPPAWDGNHQALIDRLDPKLKEIMTRDHRAVDRQIEQSLESAPTYDDVQPVERFRASSAPLRDDDVVRPS